MSDQGKSVDGVQNEVAGNSAENAENLAFSPRVLDSYELARFWSRVEVRKRDQCWPWRWGQTEAGYGEHCFNDGNAIPAHRMAYRIGKGDIPARYVVRHTCDNPMCCNPKHLVTGTHQDNVADRVERNRSARGEGNARHKLTELGVRLIRSSPLSDKYFANRFDVHEDTIRDVRIRKTWTHI